MGVDISLIAYEKSQFDTCCGGDRRSSVVIRTTRLVTTFGYSGKINCHSVVSPFRPRADLQICRTKQNEPVVRDVLCTRYSEKCPSALPMTPSRGQLPTSFVSGMLIQKLLPCRDASEFGQLPSLPYIRLSIPEALLKLDLCYGLLNCLLYLSYHTYLF